MTEMIFPNPAIKLSHNFFFSFYLLNDITVNEDKYHVYHQKENKLILAILSTVPSPTFFSLHKADHVVGTCSSQANTQPSTMHAHGHGSAPAIGGQPTTRCHRLFQYHPSSEVKYHCLCFKLSGSKVPPL